MISLQLSIVLLIVGIAAVLVARNVRTLWRNAMAKDKSSCGACTACPVAAKGAKH